MGTGLKPLNRFRLKAVLRPPHRALIYKHQAFARHARRPRRVAVLCPPLMAGSPRPRALRAGDMRAPYVPTATAYCYCLLLLSCPRLYRTTPPAAPAPARGTASRRVGRAVPVTPLCGVTGEPHDRIAAARAYGAAAEGWGDAVPLAAVMERGAKLFERIDGFE